MRRLSLVTLCSVGVVFASRTAHAQLTIQQPVFGVSSVATTVSVPDRGRAFLGGVSRAGESRQSFGPLRSGTNTGLFREHSGMSVHATIHDFEEMDRFLLSQAPGERTTLRGMDDPYQQLLARSQRRGQSVAATKDDLPAAAVAASRMSSAAAVVPIAPVAASATLAQPEPKFGDDGGETSFRLGRAAEERGAASVAKLHYRMAAKRGHAEALARLASLDPVVTKTAAK